MAKRFTATEKWQDPWFRRLPPDQKLGYLYLIDECDMAGTIELDRELAEFQIGSQVDWEGLVKGSSGRLVELPNGRLWVTKFIAFQHGKLSEKCNAHLAAIRLIERYQLPVECAPDTTDSSEKPKGSGRVQEPLAKGPGNGNGKGNKKGGTGENTETAKYTGDFERFWQSFPNTRRTKKREAFRNWRLVEKTVNPQVLIQRATEYAKSDKGRSEFAVMPSVWLKTGMWEDDPEAWSNRAEPHSRPSTAEANVDPAHRLFPARARA